MSAAPTTLTESADVLADSVRRLLEAVVRTQVSAADVLAAADAVEGVTALLARDLRNGPWVPDRSNPRPSPYNPVLGSGNPLAAPVVLASRTAEGVTGRAVFGTAFEGAPGLVHGGTLSMVMDQLLGEAGVAAGVGGMTVGLELRYVAPTPLNTELDMAARVVETGARTVQIEGSISVDGTTTVTAKGTFIRLSLEQARRLFPHLAGA